MRAVRFDRYGGPEVLYVAEVERPLPAEGQLLVQVKAAGLNPFETKLRSGKMQTAMQIEFPSAQGSDLAGVVQALGPGVVGFAVGDAVLGASAKRGSQAQYALVNAARVVHKPPQLSFELAGAINTVATTAHAMLAAVPVSAGETVLVSGAGGGVGSLAAQLAVGAGANVIGIASPANHDWLRSRGIVPVAYGDGIAERITDAAPLGRVDAVLDAHGGGYVQLGIELGVAPERIDTVADAPAAARHPGVKSDGGQAAVMPQALQELTDKLAAGELELRIERTFTLEEVRAAYELLEHGRPQGKIVLIP